MGSIILNRNSNKIVFEQQRVRSNDINHLMTLNIIIYLCFVLILLSFGQDEARNYMEERKVPKELQERVLLWYDYAYQR